MSSATPERFDTVLHRATPEGVSLTLRVAGAPVRALAWAIDALIVGFVAAFGAGLLSAVGEVGSGLALILIFGLQWLYPVLFEVWGRGRTPGKRFLGLQVLHDDGTPVGFQASVVRNLLRVVDFMPFAFGGALASMLLGGDGKRLGDRAAGTVVVYVEADSHGHAVPSAPPLAPSVALGREDQRAVVVYGERIRTWDAERAEELANLLEPLTGARGDAGVRRLVGVANWILGRRGAA